MTEEDAAPQALWTPGALAAMLGISPNTLRTWDHRYGLGPTARTTGGHRRYTGDDVERVRRMLAHTASGIAPAAAAALSATAEPKAESAVHPVQATSRTARSGLRRAANRLDAPLLHDIAAKLILEHGVVEAWQRVFQPLLADLGERITASGKGVEVEHVTSAAIGQALRGIPFPTRQGTMAALLACAPEEQHTLPLEALAAALSEQGHTWRNLGARVPPEALREAIDKVAPAVLVVWAHHADVAALVPVAELAGRTDVVLALAGHGWSGMSLPESVRRPASLPEAVRLVLDTVHTNPVG
jgi:DNA-binding transcriptional MerR regulator